MGCTKLLVVLLTISLAQQFSSALKSEEIREKLEELRPRMEEILRTKLTEKYSELSPEAKEKLNEKLTAFKSLSKDERREKLTELKTLMHEKFQEKRPQLSEKLHEKFAQIRPKLEAYRNSKKTENLEETKSLTDCVNVLGDIQSQAGSLQDIVKEITTAMSNIRADLTQCVQNGVSSNPAACASNIINELQKTEGNIKNDVTKVLANIKTDMGKLTSCIS